MKYNRSLIMKRAWELRREYKIGMSDALKVAWAKMKLHIACRSRIEIVRVRVHYGVYVNSFIDKIKGTYDEVAKTIEVKLYKHFLLRSKLCLITETIPQLSDVSKKLDGAITKSVGANWRDIVAQAA